MDYITESKRKTAVTGSYDVAVAGGGVAGIAAALAAKRAGAKKVILLERQYALGGLATLGLVTVYLPLCDGKGSQICFGISEELLRLSIKYGAEGRYPAAWIENKSKEEKAKYRYEVQFNPQMFAVLAEQLLIKEGVELLYGTLVCDTVVKGGKISHLILENKSGRSAIGVNCAVDASGDADLFKLSGADTVIFKQGNVLASWYYLISEGKLELNMLGFCDIPDKLKSRQEDSKVKRYKGIEGAELSAMVTDAHSNMLDNFLAGGGINPEHAIASMATLPQVRMTRRVSGLYTLDDTENGRHFDDSIGIIPDWRKAGPVYEIPFRCLYGNKIKNLISAGRCISVTDAMWDISRAIPCCAVTGEAAGTAAALTDDFALPDISRIQEALKKQGVKLSL